jgi:hypothetical protein
VDWYGGQRREMQVFSRTGLWHTRGHDPVAIRVAVHGGIVTDPV